MNELAEDVREIANQYAGLPVKLPEVKLLVRTLLTVARVIELGVADQMTVCFVLKEDIPSPTVIPFHSRKEFHDG